AGPFKFTARTNLAACSSASPATAMQAAANSHRNALGTVLFMVFHNYPQSSERRKKENTPALTSSPPPAYSPWRYASPRRQDLQNVPHGHPVRSPQVPTLPPFSKPIVDGHVPSRLHY